MNDSLYCSQPTIVQTLTHRVAKVSAISTVCMGLCCGGGGHERQRDKVRMMWRRPLFPLVSSLPSYPRSSSGPSAWSRCHCSTPRSDWWNTPGPSWLCGGEWLSSSSCEKWAVKAQWKRKGRKVEEDEKRTRKWIKRCGSVEPERRCLAKHRRGTMQVKKQSREVEG